MAIIKPWHKVATPREDLREGRPLDAAEFAVHLDHVRDGRASEDYQDPERFFDRTYLTKNLTLPGSQVLRRLSGEMTETSAVFNMATQFGGGKTHALTLLYHLANGGPGARAWTGVQTLLNDAGVAQVPAAATAVLVGTEFDSIRGRGGDDGTPRRTTPWGEIAFQLGGAAAFEVVEDHDKQGEAPGGDVIRDFLPQDRPALILMDELMNYISRSRKSGLSAQLYDFLHNLSETARGQRGVVLVASIPASELEMTVEDRSDYDRFFEQDIDPAEVELSDDMFILTAEQARKCIEPPALKYIEVRPERPSVEPGKSLAFTFRSLDQHGQEYPIENVSWSATGGEITDAGVFHAGNDEGDFTVAATAGATQTTVRVAVSKRATPSIDKPPVPSEHVGLKWSGQVPPQKWMHFYSKVLAKCVSAGNLTVTVSISASPTGGVSPQQVEETTSALRELGLSPDVESQ